MASKIRAPPNLSLPVEAHKKWLIMLKEAELLVQNDKDLQDKAAKGLRLKERNLPAEVLGRIYSQYCCLINKIYDAYLNNVQLQKAPYMLEIVSMFMKRLYELRNEFVHLIVNDYIYFDVGLIQNKLTPQDIELVVPYDFPLECRSEETEQLLKKMWAESIKRKNTPPKVVISKPAPSTLGVGMFGSDEDLQFQTPEPEVEPESESEECEPEPSVHTVIPEDFIQATIIQTHERFRQWFMKDFKTQCNRRKTYFADKVVEAPLQLRHRAASLIQKAYREFMKMKRQSVMDAKRNVILGLVPDPWVGRLDYDEENKKVYERRRQTRLKLQQTFLEEMEKEKIRLLFFKKEDQIDDITEQIREWFREWYVGYGFFPEFPYELEGGTMLVMRGDFPTIEEKQEEDEKYIAATKGRTKEQLKQEKLQAKLDAEIKAELAKEAAKKEAEQMMKMRCNPFSDPGYQPKKSQFMDKLINALQGYRAAWSLYDDMQPEKCAEIIYGYIHHVLTEDLMCQIHLDARKYVDELMRLDLKLLIKSQQIMYKNVGWKYPKMRPRPKPKEPPVPKILVVDDALLKNFEKLFDLGIISKPTAKLKDVYGDSSYAAYDCNIRDPNATFPLPGYGDIKNRLTLSCIYGIGVNPGATRKKAVLLLGPKRNGKSFLVDVVAGELNAVKIDISPEVFSAVADKPKKLMAQVFQAARVFQPSVIYLKNIERVFAKKVTPENKRLKAKSVKAPLIKWLKSLPAEDKVIFIATCSDPSSAKAKPLVSTFNEVLLVPRADYASVQQFFYTKLQRIRSMPRDYCVHAIAHLLQGYGFGVINEVFNKIMSPERIVRLNIKPLEPIEFLEQLIEEEVDVLTKEEYEESFVKFFISKSPGLKKEREEYEIINRVREVLYKKLVKDPEE